MFVSMLVAASVASATGQTRKIEIEGALYRVTLKGQTFEVARKSLITVMSTAERERMFRALSEVTSCKPTREWMAGNILMGQLDCEK